MAEVADYPDSLLLMTISRLLPFADDLCQSLLLSAVIEHAGVATRKRDGDDAK
jgi:hypothetical protein